MLSLVLFLMLSQHKFPLRFEGAHQQTDQNTHLTYIPVTQIRSFRFGVEQVEGPVLTRDITLQCSSHRDTTHTFIENLDKTKTSVDFDILHWKCEDSKGTQYDFRVIGIEEDEP